MILFNTEAEKSLRDLGWTIKDIGLDGRSDYFKEANWWRLMYKFLSFSIYYDPSDILGSVGEPYYELYDGDETYRYTVREGSDELIEALETYISIHKKEIKEFPELFL